MEKQFDDTNKGALFEPFSTENILLNGTVDIDGTKTKVIATKVELNNGTTMLKLYSEFGTVFDNGELYSGKIGVYNKDTKKPELDIFKELSVDMIAGRKKSDKNGKSYLSVSLYKSKPKEPELEMVANNTDDEIPPF